MPCALTEIDDDGSGKLDNKELVQAWQKATGEELTADQAQEMIDEVDEDKNGTLDQDEFIALIRKRCEQPLRSFADQFSDEKLVEIFESELGLGSRLGLGSGFGYWSRPSKVSPGGRPCQRRTGSVSACTRCRRHGHCPHCRTGSAISYGIFAMFGLWPS